MHLIQPQRHARRAFLRRSSQLAMTGAALPIALNLSAIGQAAAFSATDYKALVCVFLYGGSDYANSVVTYDSPSYDLYSTIRGGGAGQSAGGIALGRADLAATLLTPGAALPGGRQYALHPSMTGLAGLFNGGKAAVLLNVGPLVVPLTKAQYNSPDRKLYPLPPKLFSHNDQQSVWQSSSPEGSTVGWGGNLGDLAMASNGNSLFTCISATGNSVFLVGDSALQYQVGTTGAVPINGVKAAVNGSVAVKSALTTLIQQSRPHTLENEYNRVTQRSIAAEAQITGALAGVSLATVFPSGNSLADQLKIVARLIAARNSLGSRRQVFMVSLGGFDLHDNLIAQQPGLLAGVSAAMTAFYNATLEMGLADKVTSFTTSDFGRTLSSNGDGSDHGWGGHHLIVGGAVKGKAFYGTPPPVSITDTSSPNDQWHVGQGRLLPSTAVDQYAATLARWFGVSDTEMAGVLPNIGHFGAAGGRADYPTDLGFLA
ncbi:MAG: DUF1501 domain-containing protein [Burkholderiaceae bacterium]|nr:DUF1501 domain-containing protein [Burkholderiaceae bacterium]